MNDRILIAWTTLPNKKRAIELAHTLIREKLCACAQIDSNITSIFSWEGEIQQESECRLLMKYTSSTHAKLEKRIQEVHPYKTPQWIYFEGNASNEYAGWIQGNL